LCGAAERERLGEPIPAIDPHISLLPLFAVIRKGCFLLATLLAPIPVSAQAGTTLSTYVGVGSGIENVPVLVGGTLTSEMNRFGLRLGVAVDARDTPFGGVFGSGTSRSAWAADLDVTASGRHLARFLAPYYLTAGVGVRSWTQDGAVFAQVASVGAGYQRDLISRLSMETEVRYRAALGANGAARAGGAEFRLGLSVRLHGGGDRAAPRPAVGRASASLPAARPADSAARPAVRLTFAEADRYLGTPYLWGGSSPERGFDCSGFVQYLFRKQGIDLPRVSRDQALAGRPVSPELDQLREGDLLLFASDGSWIDHVAIYAGGGWILHSSSSGGGVRYDRLEGPRGDWYLRKLVGARRVLDLS
jgi:cell wall-associated NlpC family hydrolase